MMASLCITERDEASTDASDHNSTSFTEVDKRVKRRLLMGNNDTPVSRSDQPDGRAALPGTTQGCC